MADLKKIILHPINPDGSRDDSISYYPKTDASIVHYDTVEKEIVIPPAELVDGNTYTLPTEYDLSTIDFGLDATNIDLYEDDNICIGVSQDGSFKVIYVEMSEVEPAYNSQDNQWEVYDGQPIPYTDSITFTYDETCLNTEESEYLDFFKFVLGLVPKTEKIMVERNLTDKIVDVKNWEYSSESHTEIIPALTTGTEYKINFDATTYTDLLDYYTLSDVEMYEDQTNDIYIGSNGYSYYTINIYDYNNQSYTFIFDLTDTTKFGAWRTGYEGSEWSTTALENLAIDWDSSAINSSQDTALVDAFIKTIFKNIDGTTIDNLQDGTTYKFDYNITNYRDIFDSLYDNFYSHHSTIYENSNSGSGNKIKRISIYTYSIPTPYIQFYSNNYYFIPSISEEYYPGRWVDNCPSYNVTHYYTDKELAALSNINFDRNNIKSTEGEALLHRLLLNIDGTPIADDQEEEITEITTMDQKMNEPLVNKLYGSVEKTIEVANDFVDNTEYDFNADMKFTAEEVFKLFFNIEGTTSIYVNDNTNEHIWITTGSVWEIHYQDSNNNEYEYGVVYAKTGELINQWAAGIPTSMCVYLNCINPNYVDILKKVFALGTHTETVYEDITLKEKVEDLPNWKYGSSTGLYIIPKWDAFAPYIDKGDDIYSEMSPKRYVNISFDYDTDTYGEGNCGIWAEINSADGHYYYCIYKGDYQLFEANTWYDITDESKLPTKLDNPPKLELNVQYADPDYIDLFNAIYGEEVITLKDELNSPLKDKTYDNITKQISIPDDFVDGNNYDFKANMNFSYSDQDMIDQMLNGTNTLIYSEGENSNKIYVDILRYRTEGYTFNIFYYDASNDTTYLYYVCTNDGTDTAYINTWDTKPLDIQIHTSAIVNLDWLNRIVENTTHQGTETVAQTLEEKFTEVEAKINSHTDTGVLKDKIYDNTIELENGQEYSLATDMEPFFDRFGSNSATLIYGSTGSSGGGDIPMPASQDAMLTNSVSDGTITRDDASSYEPSDSGSLGEIYITRIALVTTTTPIKKDTLLKADSGVKSSAELRAVDSVSLGETYVEVRDNYYNYYRYYKGADSWVDTNGNSVTAANLPKFKLDTTLVKNFEMLTNVLQTIPQTLEAKLSEGIANWNYEQGKISSFPEYAPLFNVMSVIQTNSSIVGQAGLFNDQNGTRIYQDDTTTIEWSCDNSNYTLNIYYNILDEAESLIYEINCAISMSNNTETWTGAAIPSTGSSGIIVSPTTIYSQEELPFIEYYSPANIESGYEQVVPLLLTEIYAKGEPTTLAEKIADVKNWEYSSTPTAYKFNKTVDWSKLPADSEISDDIRIYYDDTTSWYTTLVLKDDTINYLLYKPQYLQALDYPQYRNYRLDYTDADTGSTAEAGKWYYVERVKTSQYSYGDKFIEVTPIEDFNSLYIINQELFKVIVDSTEAQDYTVADMVEGPLKDKTYGNVLQEKLVDNAEYNLKAALNTGDGNKLMTMSENCADLAANVGEYDTGMASPWTSFMLNGYLIATGANNSWYYLDETTTWQKIENIEIINGSSDITDYNKRIASQGTFTYNNKTYLAWPTAWPNQTFNQYVIPCTDNGTRMIYEIEFDPSYKTITLTGHKLSFNATPSDGYLYGNKFFEFNNTLLYADSGYNNYIYEIDLENDTATKGIYNKFKCKYGSGTSITNIIAEETLGSFEGRHIITPINGVDFTKWHGADNNGTGTFFKIRHATAAEVAQYPDLNLSETTSVIYDLINPANPTCGINSTVQSTSAATVRGYVASGRFIYTHNGTDYLGSLYYYYNNGTTKYFAYKFNESTNTWSTVTLNRPTDISDNSFLSGNKFIYDDVSQNTYLVDNYKNIYRVTGLENNQINFEKITINGIGYPYANPAPEDGEVAQIECSYSAAANSYIDTLYIKDAGEIVPIAYCDGSDYWKDIDTNQQIDVSNYAIYNIRKFFDIHVDSALLELIANLETEVPVTLEEKLDSISQFPACPTDTDGTYVLEATVSSGVVTYTWVLKSS